MITGDVDKLASTDIQAFLSFKENMAFKLEVEDGFFRGNQRLMIRHIHSHLSSSVAATMRPYLNTCNTATEFLFIILFIYLV